MADRFEDGWFQQQIVPAKVIEATLRIGIVEDVDHAQVQIEVCDPTTKVLIAMSSHPHMPIRDAQRSARIALVELFNQIDEAMERDPFPDR